MTFRFPRPFGRGPIDARGEFRGVWGVKELSAAVWPRPH